MVSGWLDFGALEFYGLRPVAGGASSSATADDGRLVSGDSTGNPSIVINETAMRALGFAWPAQAIGKTVIWRSTPLQLQAHRPA